jgi:hypothetical protein
VAEDEDSTSHDPPPVDVLPRKGRVFALWKKHYFTATVTDSWEASEEETPVEVPLVKGKAKAKGKDKGKTKEVATQPSGIICHIKFDDGTLTKLPLQTLYRCELREDDEIKVPGKRGGKLGRTGVVSSTKSWVEEETVEVLLSTSPQKEKITVVAKDLAADANVVKSSWTNRAVVSLEDIGLGESPRDAVEGERVRQAAKHRDRRASIPGENRSEASLPPISRQPGPSPPRVRKQTDTSTEDHPSAPPSKRQLTAHFSSLPVDPKKPLRGHMFIIALTVHDEEFNQADEKERKALKQKRDAVKTRLQNSITKLGGQVIDGFDNLISWGGQIGDDEKRWIWTAASPEDPANNSAGWKTKNTAQSVPDRLFVLADASNCHLKYLMALAAGVPCVDKAWIEDNVSRIRFPFSVSANGDYLG